MPTWLFLFCEGTSPNYFLHSFYLIIIGWTHIGNCCTWIIIQKFILFFKSKWWVLYLETPMRRRIIRWFSWEILGLAKQPSYNDSRIINLKQNKMYECPLSIGYDWHRFCRQKCYRAWAHISFTVVGYSWPIKIQITDPKLPQGCHLCNIRLRHHE